MRPFWTSLLRSIRDSAGRFIAIAAIVALGCGFYGGLRMTGPDMRIAADRFFDGTHLHDIRLLSTLGFSDFQVDEVADIEGVAAVMPAKSTDVMAQINEEQYALRLSSLPAGYMSKSTCADGCNVVSPSETYLNRLVLARGRWPQKAGECVVSADRVSGVPIEIGDTLEVLYGSQDLENVLEMRTLTIVGTAHSSAFVSAVTMGATSLGSGSIQQFAYVLEDTFAANAPYTEVFLEVEGASELFSGSDEYRAHVDEVGARIEERAADMASERLEDVRAEAQETLDKNTADYEKERADALDELDDAKRKLDDAKAEIDDGQKKVDEGQEELDAAKEQLKDAREQAKAELDAAREQLDASQRELDASAAELEEGRTQAQEWPAQREALQSQLDQATEGLSAAQQGMAQASAARPQLESQLAALPEGSPQRAQVQAQLDALTTQQSELSATITQLTSSVTKLKDGIAQGDAQYAVFQDSEDQLAAAREQLEAGKQEFAAREQETNDQLDAAQDEFDESKKELDDAKKELSEGKKELEESQEKYDKERKKALDELDDAKRKLDEAQEDIDALEEPDIFVLDREKNYGANSLEADSERIDNIGRVFPFIFFLVAALVALTTMTRMVDEERTLIGTFKALGYGKGAIACRYLLYAGAASVLGAVVGLAVLSQVLPYTIAAAYAIIYNIPSLPLPLPFDWKLAGYSGGLGIVITLGATLAAVLATLREQPAQLMLPRAPKAGKRILLERVPLIWKRLSFSWKVTVRNLIRYKKRLLMTVAGIAGCTALLLTGWGLHDSIWDIIDKQYGPVVNYNVVVKLDEDTDADELAKVEEYMRVQGDTDDITRAASLNMQAGSPAHDELSVEVVIPQNTDEFGKLLFMKERTSQEPLAFDDESVVLTEKLARFLDVSVGETFMLYEQDDIGNPVGDGYEFAVSGIMENYIGNWAYIGRDAMERALCKSSAFTALYGRCMEGVDERAAFTEGLHDIDGVRTVAYNDETIDSYRTMLSSVDMIVVVLVVSAALLAFIVVYNLTNINITERRREIASLKVLGFSRHEVYAYIFREIAILAVLGAALGLVLGTFLESFVCVTAEVDYVMFGRDIHLASYVISFVLTLLFTAIAMLFMRGKLNRIDMVESLKSID